VIRRYALALLTAMSAGALAGCGAGTLAATSTERSVIPGINTDFGSIALRDVYLEPNPNGSGAFLFAVIINAGAPDTLTGISTAAGPATWSNHATSVTLATNQPLTIADPVTGMTGTTVQVPLPTGATPGVAVPVTLTFANAGSTTVVTPVFVNSGTTNSASPIPTSS
jgi:copper(I)-binding protein